MRLALSLFCLVALCAGMARADDAPPADPFVALDAAKMTLADGRLEDARKELAQIPLGQAEPYVDEEVMLQRMLLEAAFLDAANFLWTELGQMNLGGGGYAKWLWGERDRYASDLASELRSYLELTKDGYALTFVRFRLPEVSEQHIEDVGLYSDRQVLEAAAQNWDDGRDGLGRGLIIAQARVAVTLSAASFYDLPQRGNIEQVQQRLIAGVPVSPATTLDWIAETCHRLAGAGNGLGQIGKSADERLARIIAEYPNGALYLRMSARAAPPKAAAAPETKSVKQSKKKKRGRRRR